MSDLLTERLLDPKAITIRQNGDGLTLQMATREEPISHIVRCFPFSTPDQWLSLRNLQGTEIGILQTSSGLDDESRQIVESRLKDRYYIPTIQSILSINMGSAGSIWELETDEGITTIHLRGDRGVDLGGFPKIILTDGITRKRFVILDFMDLDRPSQKLGRAHMPISSRGGHSHRGGGHRFR